VVQVPQGIIQLATHPPFGVLSRETGPTLSTGQYAVKRIRGPVNVDCFGISFSFITIPATFGYDLGIINRYELPIVKWGAQYTDLTGHNVESQLTEVHEEGLYYYFEDLFPTQLDIWVQVACTVTVFFLVAL